MDFSKLKSLTIPEGKVKQIVAGGKVLWKLARGLLSQAKNADGTPYEGGKGYKAGYRILAAGTEYAASGAYCTGYMPITGNGTDCIYIKDITMHSSSSTNAIFLGDASNTKVFHSAFGESGYYWAKLSNGVWRIGPLNQMTGSYSKVAFFRFSCGGITDDTIVTVNEEIK